MGEVGSPVAVPIFRVSVSRGYTKSGPCRFITSTARDTAASGKIIHFI